MLIVSLYKIKALCLLHLNMFFSESAKLRGLRAKNVLTSQPALRAFVLTCQRVLHAYVLTCQRALCAYVLTC